MTSQNFASALAFYMGRLGLEARPTVLRRHLASNDLEVTRGACDHWLTGSRRPSRELLPEIADSLKLEGADRLHFYELACAS